MFSGQYQYRLDNKGRVPLPPRFREGFKAGLVLARGVALCVQLHPKDQWDDTTRALFQAQRTTDRNETLARYIYSTTQEADMDSAGRVMVPPPFRAYANLGNDVIVVGAGRYLELWDLATWQSNFGGLEQEAKRLLRGLEAQE